VWIPNGFLFISCIFLLWRAGNVDSFSLLPNSFS
jgi:hypothetical protein